MLIEINLISINFNLIKNIQLEFLIIQTFQTMALDSLETSHPINFELNNPNELTVLFDAISYHKVINKRIHLFKVKY